MGRRLVLLVSKTPKRGVEGAFGHRLADGAHTRKYERSTARDRMKTLEDSDGLRALRQASYRSVRLCLPFSVDQDNLPTNSSSLRARPSARRAASASGATAGRDASS